MHLVWKLIHFKILPCWLIRRIADEETSSLQLDDVTLLDTSQFWVSKHHYISLLKDKLNKAKLD